MSVISSKGHQLRDEFGEAELKSYVEATGDVLGSIQWRLMRPIIREHRDLDPHQPESDSEP